MNFWRSIDIDQIKDFYIAKILYKKLKRQI